MMLAFDFTIFNSRRRTVSNVPAQALILMNDPLHLNRRNAGQTEFCPTDAKRSNSRLDRLYLAAFARHPTSPLKLPRQRLFKAQGVTVARTSVRRGQTCAMSTLM